MNKIILTILLIFLFASPICAAQVQVLWSANTDSVSAFDTSGNESIRSDSISIKIDTTAPNKPTGIKAIIAKLVAWLRSLKG